MNVTVIFPNRQRITWSFQNAVPRVGDQLHFTDPEAPQSVVRIETVTWVVTERGCNEIEVIVA